MLFEKGLPITLAITYVRTDDLLKLLKKNWKMEDKEK